MPWGVAAAAAISVVGGMAAAEDAEDAQHAANQSQDASTRVQQQLANMSQEEWDLYKEHAVPILKQLAAGSTTADRTDEEVALAARDTKTAYAAGRRSLMRAANLEASPGSDRANALLAPSYTDEASQVAGAITNARRAERARKEDTDWGRKLQTVGAFQRLPQDASANLQGAGAIATRNAAISSDQAKSFSQDASQAAYGGVYLAANANRWMNRGKPAGGAPPSSGATGPMGGMFDGQDMSQADYTAGYYRHGGAVRGRPQYADGGPIQGPGTGTSDSINATAEEGSFVLSADTVRAIGVQKINQIMEKAGVRPGMGGDDKGGLPVRLSNGEYQIPRQVVQYHGEEFFNKLQQKYHRPVEDDGGNAHANGGAIRKRGLPKAVEDAIFRTMPNRALSRSRG